MTEFYRLSNVLAWRVEYLGCVRSTLNYESSNAASALRHVDYILGEKNV
nr:MAG TPA: hypothetical protein [Caudoviricetes sp.]